MRIYLIGGAILAALPALASAQTTSGSSNGSGQTVGTAKPDDAATGRTPAGRAARAGDAASSARAGSTDSTTGSSPNTPTSGASIGTDPSVGSTSSPLGTSVGTTAGSTATTPR